MKRLSFIIQFKIDFYYCLSVVEKCLKKFLPIVSHLSAMACFLLTSQALSLVWHNPFVSQAFLRRSCSRQAFERFVQYLCCANFCILLIWANHVRNVCWKNSIWLSQDFVLQNLYLSVKILSKLSVNEILPRRATLLYIFH